VRSAKGAEFDSQGASAEQARRVGSAKGAEYGSQGQALSSAKRVAPG